MDKKMILLVQILTLWLALMLTSFAPAWSQVDSSILSNDPVRYHGASQAEDTSIMKWLRTHAVALKTVNAGSGFVDLEPIKEIVGDARIVLLGEATHGTREFFQLTHRILEFLITEMGFTTVAIEAFWSRVLPVNDFVLTGKDSASKALSTLGMWIWDTEEVLEMIRWMREYNSSVPDTSQVSFYGYDMQDGWSSIRALIKYLHEVDPQYAETASVILAPLGRIETSYDSVRGYSKWPKKELAAISRGIDEILQRLTDKKSEYVAKSSSRNWAIAHQHAMIVAQAEETWHNPDWPNTGEMRDRFMAENIAAILDREGPRSKIVIWAHNAHVAKSLWSGNKTVGYFLNEKFSSQMVVFGLGFNQGSFQAWHKDGTAVMEHTVGPAPPGSVSATLAKVDLPLFLVDLRRAPSSGPVADWLHSKHPERSVGSQFNPEWEPVQIAPAECYDVLVFVEKTTRAQPTPTGVRVRKK